MVTTNAYTLDGRYRTNPGEGFDGVVRISYSGQSASGTLLFDGRAVLTAAHLFEGRSGTATVNFDTRSGAQSLSSAKILAHPSYDSQSNHDLALVWLSTPAPSAADRYGLYRDSNEIGRAFTLVGFGKTGTGQTGITSNESSPPIRLKAENQFDADAASLKAELGGGMSWTPAPGKQLVADFDNGISANDALGRLLGLNDFGRGALEGLVAQGDSGGPALIGNQIAGVASYTTSLSKGAIRPDIDSILTNSSFGEIGAWQRVSAYQQWIDQSLRAQYLDAPTRPDQVQKIVSEADAGTSLAYFLVQFNGSRQQADATISVDYATRDGSALAGSDYIATRGRLNLYPGEQHAAIAVEIIGDRIAEPTEFFYLDIFNPNGGAFAPGVLQLTAVRTILDQDGWLG
ncbi:MAG: trypsin-like serine protease [Burkholderiaceae bacterium]